MSPRSVRSAGGASSAAEEVVSSLSTSLKLSEIRTRPAEKDLESARRGPLTVYAATWNLNGKMPPHRLPELLGIGPSSTFCDLYAVGVQEAPSIGIELQVLATLGTEYKKLAHVSLASIHLTLFVRKELASEMSDIHTDRVATGVAAFFGNKGGVAAAFTYQGTTFLFATCHLAAHQDAVLERNDQFGRISRALFSKERDWARRVNQERIHSPRPPQALRSPPPQTALSNQSAASQNRPGTSSPGTSHQSAASQNRPGTSSPGTHLSGQSSESGTSSGAASYRSDGPSFQQDPHVNGWPGNGDGLTEIQPTGLDSSPLSPHSTPGQFTASRKDDKRVLESSVAGAPPEPSISSEALPKPHVADDFDVIVWSGDLNYRVEGNRRVADAALEQNLLEVLRANDQLLRGRQAGSVFQGYEEGDLSFTPTYKFDDRSQRYDSSTKSRIPSWTDRILYRSRNPARATVKLDSYGSVPSLTTSDHRPVYARFTIATGRSIGNGSEVKEKRFVDTREILERTSMPAS